MAEVVDITLGVIERMNLTEEDKKELINQLSATLTVNEPKKPKAMTYDEKYEKRFMKWAIENKILFAPKKLAI
ncbi:hypothetical protein PL373_13370 [Tenacibaculum maritimum]|nr:hypothetical protein [Tenacibaculum maritimum]MDB0600285.1 hypothetical protein [Tenacibaculum maritimum]MDB0602119.1 hypothetical protein [Tenacibaculum maritimum]MDB0610795.1 hypothetical protein [Tenacibaculum maritimum]